MSRNTVTVFVGEHIVSLLSPMQIINYFELDNNSCRAILIRYRRRELANLAFLSLECDHEISGIPLFW